MADPKEKPGKTMEEADHDFDAAAGIVPKAKTPGEMKKNPMDLLDPERSQTLEEQQRKLDIAWQNGLGEPTIGHDAPQKPPGSGANEGRGRHDWSINDNDSKNGPVR